MQKPTQNESDSDTTFWNCEQKTHHLVGSEDSERQSTEEDQADRCSDWTNYANIVDQGESNRLDEDVSFYALDGIVVT